MSYQSSTLNIRPLPSSRRRANSKPAKNKNQHGFIRLATMLFIAGFLVWGSSTTIGLSAPKQAAYQPEINSGQPGYCLDNYHDALKPGSVVDSWACNGTNAQNWIHVNGRIVKNGGKYCLSENDSKVVLASCSSANNQIWVADGVGLKNRANGQCLSLPGGKTKVQLVTANCNRLDSLSEAWTPSFWRGKPIGEVSSLPCTQSNLGDRVACIAQNEWLAWQTEPKLHKALLYDYTDGNPTEEWCADFVSFIYMQAGDPFTNGERGNGGWDEYNANNVINEAFSYHAERSGYLPRPGDVAYFDYNGGHVEIVVKGGPHPTFIYGDSGTIDPLSGNGTMAENQIVSDGSLGSLQYYLSPN